VTKKNPFTVLTLTATIKKSQSGCCVIVEGSDDIVVYRSLITLYQSKGIKVLAAGGRKNVLDIFDALKDTEHLKKAIFIVDQDSWVLLEFLQNINILGFSALVVILLKMMFILIKI